jgi:hypothetical protein
MFDFVFGGKRKLALIRELLEQRMREEGFDDMDSRLKVKELGKLQLVSSPEGTLVTIIETVIKSQRQGVLLGQIITSIENHRKKQLGSDPQEYKQIINMAIGSQAGEAVFAYCQYRLNLEHNGRVTHDQSLKAFEQAVQEITSW